MQNNEIEIMYCQEQFKSKPQGSTIGWVQKQLIKRKIALEDLAEGLCHGATFKPGVLAGGQKAENWIQQQLFGLDFDDGITIAEAYQRVTELGILPCFGYTTFNHKAEHHKFRMIFCNDTVITDGDIRDKLQATLMGAIGGIDKVCFNRDRLFFGGNGGEVLFPAYSQRIDAVHIIGMYWDEEYERYIKATSPKTIKRKASIARTRREDTEIVDENNTEVISKLDIEGLRRRLKGMKVELIEEDSSISVTPLSDTTGMFEGEDELYRYINQIDLQEYLGVPDGMFSCILPEHEDDTPSAHVFITDDGTPIYKCFGCGCACTIITITEKLAKCKRSEAIEFIKAVYGLEYRISEWSEVHRKKMIDSAEYLDSEDFKDNFPKLYQVIRTRRIDIQKILMHMSNYVQDGMVLNGKPLFFMSYTSLMDICETKKKARISQSITLFTLLQMMTKVDPKEIPQEELKKAQAIAAKHGFKKIVNYYQFEEYNADRLEESERRAQILLENNMTLKGLSREYVLRTFGVQVADQVFPQYKYENKKGPSEQSENHTMDLSEYLLTKIQNQGFMYEKELNQDNSIGVQWKKSIQQILDTYGLKRIKLNKEIKQKLGIECKGYPYVIYDEQYQKRTARITHIGYIAISEGQRLKCAA